MQWLQHKVAADIAADHDPAILQVCTQALVEAVDLNQAAIREAQRREHGVLSFIPATGHGAGWH